MGIQFQNPIIYEVFVWYFKKVENPVFYEVLVQYVIQNGIQA